MLLFSGGSKGSSWGAGGGGRRGGGECCSGEPPFGVLYRDEYRIQILVPASHNWGILGLTKLQPPIANYNPILPKILEPPMLLLLFQL